MFYKVVFFDSPANRKRFRELKSFLDINHTYTEDNFEYLFVIGGDGSFIHFSKKYAFASTKIIGVKGEKHSVAFLSSFSVKDEDLESLEFSNLELLCLEGQDKEFAFNDIYISGDKNLLMNLDMELNGMFLQRYRGTGLLLSTKAGSTAKNKSFLGPIIFPNTNAWLISEIGAQQNRIVKSINNSMVISENDVLRISGLKSYRIFIDGRLINLDDDTLTVRLIKTNSKVRLLDTSEYINKLRKTFIS